MCVRGGKPVVSLKLSIVRCFLHVVYMSDTVTSLFRSQRAGESELEKVSSVCMCTCRKPAWLWKSLGKKRARSICLRLSVDYATSPFSPHRLVVCLCLWRDRRGPAPSLAGGPEKPCDSFRVIGLVGGRLGLEPPAQASAFSVDKLLLSMERVSKGLHCPSFCFSVWLCNTQPFQKQNLGCDADSSWAT